MRARRRRLDASATFGLLLLSAAAAFSGCGDDPKKQSRDAGAGEAGATQADAGEPSAGGSGDVPAAGRASDGGAGPSLGGASTGGAGPGPDLDTLAPFGMLFSVTPGSQGVTDTGVADAAPDVASNLYTSTGSGATHEQGTNALGNTFTDLGLDAGDDLDAVSVIHPAAASAFYFSVIDTAAHDEGIDGSAVRRSSTAGEVQSDIFVTHALAPLNGDGSNLEWVDEYRLGLNPEAEGEPAPDNLNALDINVPPGTTPVFFSVSPDSLGAVDSAVAGVAANELGCTIFSSALDGTNEVAFTCAQLGLAPGDDVDALVVLGVGDQARTMLFSVTPDSVGAAASGVALQAGEAAADVFASDGTGDNLLYIEERALGLLADDDLDALAVETASDPGGTWLPPPPEDPPPPELPPCPWDLARVRTNPGADDPVPHSLPSMGTRVATPGGKIIRSSTRVRRLSQADANRINALQKCGARRTLAGPPGSPPSRFEVICPPGATELAPGNFVIATLETEEELDFGAFQQVQVALIVDTDGEPGNNYLAQPPYTFDTFDNTDRVIQLQQNGSLLTARAQDISVNPFQDINSVADRVIIQGRHYTFVMQVDEAMAYRYRLTFYAANGGEWTMSNVNLVGEPMAVADLSSCP